MFLIERFVFLPPLEAIQKAIQEAIRLVVETGDETEKSQRVKKK
jgi:hypothetical protein